MAEIKVEIEGLDELQRKLNSPFAAKPARNFLNRGTLLIQRAARENVHSDRGRLVDSIDREIDTALLPLWGKVGSDLDYAPYVEFGTGPHMPPVAPLEAWAAQGLRHRTRHLAQRHGGAALLAGRRGGCAIKRQCARADFCEGT